MWLFKTKKDRVIKELLQKLIVEIEQDDRFSGMCGLLQIMYYTERINFENWKLLSNYLREHRPHNAGIWWWTKGLKQPRIDWLKDRISKH